VSGPVDVLAVWDAEVEAFRNTASLVKVGIPGRETAYAEHLARLERTRAAVAELLEASHEFARGMPPSLADNTAVIGGVNAQALERVRAAVRSAKGMQP